MTYKTLLSLAIYVALSNAATAQENTIDCADPANAALPTCTQLPAGGEVITNFAPFLAPLLTGAFFLTAVTGGADDTTTSTTSTN